MKSHVADFATRIYCARIEPANDAPVVRMVAYPHDLAMSNGAVYLAENGYEFSGYGSSTTFASASVDLSGILKAGVVSRDDIASGIYDNARVKFYATTWGAPIEDEEPLGLMFWGAVEFDEAASTYTVEMMGAIDVLSQSVGGTFTASCPWTLFDQTLNGFVLQPSQSRCTGPRAAPDGPQLATYKVTGTLTSVTDQYMFADSARGEALDWFAYGAIRFLTGANAGLKPLEIKAFAAGGTIQTIEAFVYQPVVGDQYEMIPGCRKTPAACKTKFNNKRNFRGFEHVPTQTQYTQVGRGA